jgi:hypothetical protein
VIEKANTAKLLAALVEDEVTVSQEAAAFANPAYSWPAGAKMRPRCGSECGIQSGDFRVEE